MAGGESYHAIYLVLNDFDFFPASLRSVYEHISGATVVTSYDRDRFGRQVTPDRTIQSLLSRELDPERKVNVLVCTEGSEVSLRNRAMSFAAPPGAAQRIRAREQGMPVLAAPDWFWIIDADEIYAADDVDRLKAYVRKHPAPAYTLASTSYWRTWNWCIEPDSYRAVLVKPGLWFEHLRHVHLNPAARLARKLRHIGALPEQTHAPFIEPRRVPRAVAVFHHGDFVGSRSRIEHKLASSGHRDQVVANWLTDVWDAWTPEMSNLHPFDPPVFGAATHVPTASLPAEIRDRSWPAGWLEPM